MTKQNWMQRIGATPGKLALVGVLAVVLLGVVVGQLPDSPTAPAIARDQSAPPRTDQQRQRSPNLQRALQKTVKSNRTIPESTESVEKPADRTWPEFSLKNALAFDPLAAPDWLVAARNAPPPANASDRLLAEAQRRARKKEVLGLLREQGTNIVVISSGEKRATIGDLTVRVGDHIEGFQITDITKQGVVLTEIE